MLTHDDPTVLSYYERVPAGKAHDQLVLPDPEGASVSASTDSYIIEA